MFKRFCKNFCYLVFLYEPSYNGLNTNDLHKFGNPYKTMVSGNGSITSYYRVHWCGFIVGIGVFDDHANTCRFALVKSENDERLAIVSQPPLDVVKSTELFQLKIYFYRMFPI